MSDAQFRAIAREAAAGYPRNDRFARHFAYGKLTGDPAFEWILRQRFVVPGSRVLDVGCGQGLLGALLLASRVDALEYTGIDLRERDIERGRAMAKVLCPPSSARATFRLGDMRTEPYPAADLIVMLDVLHYVDYRSQAHVFDRATEALAPGGRLLIRVSDSSPSLRFQWTQFVDKMAMRLRGQPQRKLWCRSVRGWRDHLERRRLVVTPVPMSSGTFFANVLLVARYDSPR